MTPLKNQVQRGQRGVMTPIFNQFRDASTSVIAGERSLPCHWPALAGGAASGGCSSGARRPPVTRHGNAPSLWPQCLAWHGPNCLQSHVVRLSRVGGEVFSPAFTERMLESCRPPRRSACFGPELCDCVRCHGYSGHLMLFCGTCGAQCHVVRRSRG